MSVRHHHPEYLPPKLDYVVFAKELAQAQYASGLLQGTQGKLHNAMHLIDYYNYSRICIDRNMPMR